MDRFRKDMNTEQLYYEKGANMNKANDDKRLKALMRLRDTMTVAGVTNEMIKKGEQNSPLDLLVCSHEGIVGQYFFPEIKSAENVFYFSCLMIIDEKVGKRKQRH